MIFHTPPQNQGQIVEYSYGYSEHFGSVMMRCHDRSDNSTSYYLGESEEETDMEDADYWDRKPLISEWQEVTEEQEREWEKAGYY